jgi:hypothetical protein
MTIKNIVIPLEIEYLQKAAKERGISRSKLVRVLMEKVVRDELVPKILSDNDLAHAEAPQQRYRRFRDRRQPTKPRGNRGSFWAPHQLRRLYSGRRSSPVRSLATSGNRSGSGTSQSVQRNLPPPVFTSMKLMGLLHLGQEGGGGFLGMWHSRWIRRKRHVVWSGGDNGDRSLFHLGFVEGGKWFRREPVV